MTPYKPSRLFVTDLQRSFDPQITNTPPLPAIDWGAVNQVAPKLLSSAGHNLPTADVVVITWADAEWAAMQHVFCASGSPMPYSSRTSTWNGWTKYTTGISAYPAKGWDFWGEWRLVEISGATVMLWKSNTHLDFPGQSQLTAMIKLLIAQVKPALILSIGTAGGAQVGDHVGTVRAVSAGTLFEAGVAQAQWPDYSNAWTANDTILNQQAFAGLLLAVPTTTADLQSLVQQFNQKFGASYTLADLDPDGLNLGDREPKIADQTGGATALLTTPAFVVGTTAGVLQNFAAIEMDDAIIAQTCQAAEVQFGFVRNISDPVQNAALPDQMQQNWGSTIYDCYGFYTSYNGALAAWAMLAAGSIPHRDSAHLKMTSFH
jgi:nucleoside phosphorylase